MSLAFYMDVHIPRAVTSGLRHRGITVVTAQEDGFRTVADPILLDRATELGYPLFTQDEDLLAEAKRCHLCGGDLCSSAKHRHWDLCS